MFNMIEKNIPYISGLNIYTISAIQSVGELSSRMRAVGCFTDDVDNALGKRYSSIGASLDRDAGLFKSELLQSREMWLFFKWSGVITGESGWEEGASVGDEDTEVDSTVAGSKSRSGRGGESDGRRVSLSIISRSIALRDVYLECCQIWPWKKART